jgi:hypothetical protein
METLSLAIKEVTVMTDNRIDVFGPGFVPGKVTVTSSAASRAMSRTCAKQVDVEANASDQLAGGADVPKQSSPSSEA